VFLAVSLLTLDLQNIMVLSEISWVVVFLSSRIDKYQSILMQDSTLSDFLVKVLAIAKAENGFLSIPVVRALGNMVCGISSFSSKFLALPNIVPHLLEFLRGPSRALKKETLWLLSNLTTEMASSGYLHSLISADLIELFMSSLHHDTFDMKREAAYCVMNLYSKKNCDIGKIIESFNPVSAFLPLLRSNDGELIELGLHFFQIFLAIHGVEALFIFQETPNLVETLESLSYNEKSDVSSVAHGILETMENLDENQ
jgi:hypothetical protein